MSLLIKYKIAVARTLILTGGTVLMILGIMRGELTEILQKAIVVCLECIGIG